MEKFPTASELRKISEAEWERIYEERHQKWLQNVQQEILDSASKGDTYCEVECGKEEHFYELRNIYEPLGYKVLSRSNPYNGTVAIIRW